MRQSRRDREERLLEVLSLEPEPEPQPHRARVSSGRAGQRRRRWPWIVVVVIVVAGIAYTPVRHLLARTELAHLEAQWAPVPALDNSRFPLRQRLNDAASSSSADQALVTRAVIELRAEEARRLAAQEKAMDGDLVLGSRLNGLRAAMEVAMAKLRTNLLPGHFADSLTTGATLSQVKAQLLATQKAMGAPGPLPTSDARLTSADPALDHFAHYLDVSTGDVLVLATSIGTPEVVNIDASSAQADTFGLPPSTVVNQVVRRDGWLALLTSPASLPSQALGNTLWAVVFGHPRHPVRLATGVSVMFPASRSEAVWVEDDQGRFRELDGAGQVLLGPVSPPPAALGPLPPGVGFQPLAVGAGLAFVRQGSGVESQQIADLVLWDPATGKTGTVSRGCAEPVAASGATLAWIDCGSRHLHLTDVTTGRDRVVPNPPGSQAGLPGPYGAFSPDGAYLALSYSAGGGGAELVVVDVAQARARPIPGVPLPTYPLPTFVWAPSGHRMFFPTYGAKPVGTYRVGDPASTEVRYPPGPNGDSLLSQRFGFSPTPPLAVLSGQTLSRGGFDWPLRAELMGPSRLSVPTVRPEGLSSATTPSPARSGQGNWS